MGDGAAVIDPPPDLDIQSQLHGHLEPVRGVVILAHRVHRRQELPYRDGRLDMAITRGEGDIGEDVTHNIWTVLGIPGVIPYKEVLEVRGECVISWSDFNEINNLIPNPYSHPRNLAADSIRVLNSDTARTRRLRFVAFELVTPFLDTVAESYGFMAAQGFSVVPHVLTDDPARVIQ